MLVIVRPLAARADVEWLDSLEAGKREARATYRPILCLIVEEGQAASTSLVRNLGRSRKLTDLTPKFVCVKLEKAAAGDLIRKFDLKHSPSTVFFTWNGVSMKVMSGVVSIGKYADQMEDALEKHAKVLNPSLGAPTARPVRKRAPTRPDEAFPHGDACPVGCETCGPLIRDALAWLVKRQKPDGRWTKPADERETLSEDGKELLRSIDQIDVALTSVAGMALLAGGNRPGEGEHGRALERAVRFVSGAVRDDGLICNEPGMNYVYLIHGNFETALGATFLAEVLKARPDAGLKTRLKRVRDCFQRIQDPRSGAWGYSYDFQEYPMSIKRGWRLLATTHGVVTALACMRDAGLEVDPEVLKKGSRYLQMCRTRDGSYAYREELRLGKGYPGASAGALLALARAGAVPEEDLATSWSRFRASFTDLTGYGEHWWYFLFYGALAAAERGPGTTAWFLEHYRDVLAGVREEDGSFEDPDGNGGSIFATAIAAMTLQMPLRGLPIGSNRSRPSSIEVTSSPRYLKPPHESSRVKVFERRGRYLVDLVVSVDAPADDAWTDAFARGIVEVNRILNDLTDGQMSIHHVEIHAAKARWDEADLMVTPEFYTDEDLPQPFAHGFTMVSKRTDIRNGREKEGNRIGDWVKLPYRPRGGGEPYRFDHPALVRVVAHELCHYLFGAQDEYDVGNGRSYCDCIVGNLLATELCRPGTHTDTRREQSCWELATALYPKMKIPDFTDPGPWDPPMPVIVR